jgi:hypothetical protein
MDTETVPKTVTGAAVSLTDPLCSEPGVVCVQETRRRLGGRRLSPGDITFTYTVPEGTDINAVNAVIGGASGVDGYSYVEEKTVEEIQADFQALADAGLDVQIGSFELELDGQTNMNTDDTLNELVVAVAIVQDVGTIATLDVKKNVGGVVEPVAMDDPRTKARHNGVWMTCAELEAVGETACIIGDPLPDFASFTLLTVPCNAVTCKPTASPTSEPTTSPTNEPTKAPTKFPSATPTVLPTGEPTLSPSAFPTIEPTMHPTKEPTFNPSKNPTMQPTGYPTVFPTESPTTKNPTPSPTKWPTAPTTASPTTSQHYLTYHREPGENPFCSRGCVEVDDNELTCGAPESGVSRRQLAIAESWTDGVNTYATVTGIWNTCASNGLMPITDVNTCRAAQEASGAGWTISDFNPSYSSSTRPKCSRDRTFDFSYYHYYADAGIWESDYYKPVCILPPTESPTTATPTAAPIPTTAPTSSPTTCDTYNLMPVDTPSDEHGMTTNTSDPTYYTYDEARAYAQSLGDFFKFNINDYSLPKYDSSARPRGMFWVNDAGGKPWAAYNTHTGPSTMEAGNSYLCSGSSIYACVEKVFVPCPPPSNSPTATPTTSEPTPSPSTSPTTGSPTLPEMCCQCLQWSGSESPTNSPTKFPTTASPSASPTRSPTMPVEAAVELEVANEVPSDAIVAALPPGTNMSVSTVCASDCDAVCADPLATCTASRRRRLSTSFTVVFEFDVASTDQSQVLAKLGEFGVSTFTTQIEVSVAVDDLAAVLTAVETLPVEVKEVNVEDSTAGAAASANALNRIARVFADTSVDVTNAVVKKETTGDATVAICDPDAEMMWDLGGGDACTSCAALFTYTETECATSGVGSDTVLDVTAAITEYLPSCAPYPCTKAPSPSPTFANQCCRCILDVTSTPTDAPTASPNVKVYTMEEMLDSVRLRSAQDKAEIASAKQARRAQTRSYLRTWRKAYYDRADVVAKVDIDEATHSVANVAQYIKEREDAGANATEVRAMKITLGAEFKKKRVRPDSRLVKKTFYNIEPDQIDAVVVGDECEDPSTMIRSDIAWTLDEGWFKFHGENEVYHVDYDEPSEALFVKMYADCASSTTPVGSCALTEAITTCSLNVVNNPAIRFRLYWFGSGGMGSEDGDETDSPTPSPTTDNHLFYEQRQAIDAQYHTHYVELTTGLCTDLADCTNVVFSPACSNFEGRLVPSHNNPDIDLTGLVYVTSNGDFPFGCSATSTNLVFNDNHNSVTLCSSTNKCLCYCDTPTSSPTLAPTISGVSVDCFNRPETPTSDTTVIPVDIATLDYNRTARTATILPFPHWEAQIYWHNDPSFAYGQVTSAWTTFTPWQQNAVESLDDYTQCRFDYNPGTTARELPPECAVATNVNNDTTRFEFLAATAVCYTDLTVAQCETNLSFSVGKDGTWQSEAYTHPAHWGASYQRATAGHVSECRRYWQIINFTVSQGGSISALPESTLDATAANFNEGEVLSVTEVTWQRHPDSNEITVPASAFTFYDTTNKVYESIFFDDINTFSWTMNDRTFGTDNREYRDAVRAEYYDARIVATWQRKNENDGSWVPIEDRYAVAGLDAGDYFDTGNENTFEEIVQLAWGTTLDSNITAPGVTMNVTHFVVQSSISRRTQVHIEDIVRLELSVEWGGTQRRRRLQTGYCCTAMTATCLACMSGITVDEYCAATNKAVHGCPVVLRRAWTIKSSALESDDEANLTVSALIVVISIAVVLGMAALLYTLSSRNAGYSELNSKEL